ncbi:carboxypeptidase-like regulatory domain-containing protein [Fervidicoccus fontis]|uniref:Carboxypeptidase regulatory-like domain-containing protein n=1 Tax=Fervidicoccus fontis (strain DSM 19380 / JCM 18336 / VKM B-2539 / Kam940) TaxID=1163730 RepID=I0A130_FERFK|nr:carboxypeptidase-like regulatory domain-containing protein [Fervidicoccus fontis]AFH42687.1 hypothetical protein FFONT_0699 [Fervidicoccus fontis Kam940]
MNSKEKLLLLLIFFLLPLLSTHVASSQSVYVPTLQSIEGVVQKPFVYEIDSSFLNPYVLSDGSSILYQPSPAFVEIYNFYTNETELRYSVNGYVTAVDEGWPYIVVGTSTGEVLIIDESSNYSVRRFEAGFSQVSQLYVLDSRYVLSLFSDGSMLQYDILNDSWIAYRPLSFNSTAESVQSYQVLSIWKDGGSVLLLCTPTFAGSNKIYIQLVPSSNSTSVSGIEVLVNFTGVNLISKGITDSNGSLEVSVPSGASLSSSVDIYIASQKSGFYYYAQYILGSIINTLVTIPYPPSSMQIVRVTYFASNYILYKATPSPSGLVFTNTYSFSADRVIGLLSTDNSLGFKYILLLSESGTLNIIRLSQFLQPIGNDTYYMCNVSSFDSTKDGSYLILGYPDGTLIAFSYNGKGYSAFHSYKLTSSPSLLKALSSSPLSIIAFDGNYFNALIYSPQNNTLWPILRDENSLGYSIGGVIKSYLTNQDRALFFTGSSLLVVDGISEIFSFSYLNMSERALCSVEISVYGADGSTPQSFSISLSGPADYYTGVVYNNTVLFKDVVQGAYTLTVTPYQSIYDPEAVSIDVTGSSRIPIALSLHVFQVSIGLMDTLIKAPPKGSFQYSLYYPSGNTSSGTWIPQYQHLLLNLTYGQYAIDIIPSYSSIYQKERIYFSVPENLSFEVNLSRTTYVFGIQVIDQLTGSPAKGTFLITLNDTLGNSYSSVTQYNTIAYFTLNDVGNMSVEISPSGGSSAQMYQPTSTTVPAYSSMVYPISIERNNYTLTISVRDLDSGAYARGANVSIGGLEYTVPSNGTISIILPSDTYTVNVGGGIYQSYLQAVNLYGNTSISIGLRRLFGSLDIIVSLGSGSPISGAVVNIEGLDNKNSYTFITDSTGEVRASIPYGLYAINVTAPYCSSFTQIINVNSSSIQTIYVKMSYTLLGYFRAYLIYIVIIAIAAVAIVISRRYVKKRLELLSQQEVEEAL